MRVVRATEEHLEPVARLFDEYRQFYKQPSDPTAAIDFISARIQNNESIIFFAMDEQLDDPALGFVQLYPSFSSVSMKRLWILNDLYVANTARRHGVARSLMDHARSLAVETAAKGIVLETAADNRAAQALYEDLGYKREDDFYTYLLLL
ncbi:MAG: GNAT family N-acetyltransferase [Blastocatellia bacterium AA13]|nr:MAG: GNAT family N-acetyltransferase [Blastocatellia bacterium AA13]